MADSDRVMTGLRDALDDYLRLRRGLGYGMVREAKLLAQFIDYLEHDGAASSAQVTTSAAVAWAGLPVGGSPGWLGMRMSTVRGFAVYLHAGDPRVEVPPKGVLPGRSRRAVPYLYSEADIAALFTRAERLRTPLRVATVQTLIGLLAVTGMRIGEVVALDDGDFDTDTDLLTVRAGKNGKSRYLPLHATTAQALRGYRTQRDRWLPHPASPALLLSDAGTRIWVQSVGRIFHKLVGRAGLTDRSGSCRPRPHDLRHAFAVTTLLDWYRNCDDVTARLPLLSTYLGHVTPGHTYWYLQASPELLAEAAHRLDTLAGEPS